MADPFVGQLMLVPFTFAPRGWADCNGQILPLAQNTALFSLLGTYYGGNGTTNFALPDLQGRITVGQGQGPGLSLYDFGQQSGSATVALLHTENPPHTHTLALQASNTRFTSNRPAAAYPAVGGVYATTRDPANPLGVTASQPVGGQPHNNLQPYLALRWMIALQGVYPPRT